MDLESELEVSPGMSPGAAASNPSEAWGETVRGMQEEAGEKMDKANEQAGTFRQANVDGWEMDKDKEDVFDGAFTIDNDEDLSCDPEAVVNTATAVVHYPAPTATAL